MSFPPQGEFSNAEPDGGAVDKLTDCSLSVVNVTFVDNWLISVWINEPLVVVVVVVDVVVVGLDGRVGLGAAVVDFGTEERQSRGFNVNPERLPI